MTEETLEPVATTHEDTPPAPETTVSSEPTTSEQTTEETPTLEAPVTEKAEESPSWDDFKLTAPEGHDAASVEAFGKALQDQGMTTVAAQKALDQVLPVIQERQMTELNALHEGWQEASKTDDLIGGAKFDENMAIAKKGAEAFGDAELQDMLKPVSDGGQGLGNNPVISRLLFRVGKAIRQETNIASGDTPVAAEDGAQAIFDKSEMNA